MPPPTNRKSTSRSATAVAYPTPASANAAAVAAGGPEDLFELVLLAGVEHGEDLVARFEHRVGAGHEPLAVAQHGDQQAALRHREVAHAAPVDSAVLAEQHLDYLELLLLEVEQVDEAILGDLVLEQAQDQVGGRDRGLDSEQIEMGPVAWVVDPGDDLADVVLLFGDLADQDVVLVVPRNRDHHVGSLDPGALEHPQLGGVAIGDVVLELLLDRQVAATVALDDRHLVVLFEQLAGQIPAHLAGADDDDVHQSPSTRPPRARHRRARRPRACRSRPASGRPSAAPAAGTTRPAAGRGCGRSRWGPRSGAGRSVR